ncbi:MAG TPA: 30S ribosomal protein S6 [Candidatus Omnitrophica bacterium]|nr:30S ribosomal protein S6 [Candidatus Omnitrophota bacterium]
MKQYEGMFILKPDLDKAGVDKILGLIQELVAKHKGAISETKEMGKNRLAYPIKKNKEGIYYRINFSIIPEAISAIKNNLVLNESILRMLIIKL